MKKTMPVVLLLYVMFCAVVPVWGKDKVHWDYAETGAEGPGNWGTLDPTFSMCSDGRNQSPVDLSGMVESDLPFIRFNYTKGGSEVLNNGHTIQVNYQPGSTITVAGATFELKQFHFHSPSENTIQGQAYPLEAHFVHADGDGNLAVVAVMYRTGELNDELEKAWSMMPEAAGEKKALSAMVSGMALLPKDKDYYRFSGSLTTPPCSEGVVWLVMKDPIVASVEQIKKFTTTMHHPNNRPIQPKNARLIMK